MAFLDAFAASVFLVLLVFYVGNGWRDADLVSSRVDGRRYIVRRAKDSAEAADLLARLNARATAVIEWALRLHGGEDRTMLLSERYDPGALSEGSPEAGYTSYSVNKGEKIVMCLRSRREGGTDPGELEDENTLTYVLLHEMAHICTRETGHTPAFWENFAWLIGGAVAVGVYKDRDYGRFPANYCGITITSSSAAGKERS